MKQAFLITAVVAGLSAQVSAAFTSIVSFGDSLSDVGNLRSASFGFVPGPSGYSNGRFSNGDVWVQTLASRLNVPVATPSLSGGTNYAYGNARAAEDQTTIVSIPSVQSQINSWTANNVSSGSQLFTVLGGANDLFHALQNTSVALQPVAASQAATAIADGVRMLINDGATNILVANLPGLGSIPRFYSSPPSLASLQASLLTEVFNETLAASLATIVDPGVMIYQLDLEELFEGAIANPAAFGLTNVTDAAYTNDPNYFGGGDIVADPSGYLFWDAVHPTALGHSLVADAAFALVPEPTTAAAIIVLIAPLVGHRRRVSQLSHQA